MNEKVPSLKREIILALDSPSNMIFTIGLMNVLLFNKNRMSLIADVNHASFRIL